MRSDPPLSTRPSDGGPANPAVAEAGRRWGLVLAGWALLGLVFVLPILAQALAEGSGVPWSKVLSELLGWYLWAPLVPAVAWFCRRVPLTVDRRRGRAAAAARLLARLGLHVAFGALVAAVYVVLTLVKNELIVAAFGARPAFAAVLDVFPDYLGSGLELYLLVYFAIVGGIHAVRLYEEARDRERRSAELAGRLATAQLQLLRMQLHPHFLFNTLNAISALMRRDVDAADRAITLLSDLLRFSLEEDDRHLVPLRRELEVLDRYLEIERLRFGDRLTVELDVAEDCLGAQVPRLVLQPLVENSIRHAIAVRSAAGRIVIRARRRGERLHLAVRDDGPGPVAERRGERPGVGLANTRARLRQLYGDDHRFELVALEPGTAAELELPFEEEPRRLPAASGSR